MLGAANISRFVDPEIALGVRDKIELRPREIEAAFRRNLQALPRNAPAIRQRRIACRDHAADMGRFAVAPGRRRADDIDAGVALDRFLGQKADAERAQSRDASRLRGLREPAARGGGIVPGFAKAPERQLRLDVATLCPRLQRFRCGGQ